LGRGRILAAIDETVGLKPRTLMEEELYALLAMKQMQSTGVVDLKDSRLVDIPGESGWPCWEYWWTGWIYMWKGVEIDT